MRTMVTLKQIKISESEASAYYYPEDSTDPGFLVVDLLTEEVKHIDRAPGYEYGMSASHARRELVRMAKAGDKRTERVVMWY